MGYKSQKSRGVTETKHSAKVFRHISDFMAQTNPCIYKPVTNFKGIDNYLQEFHSEISVVCLFGVKYLLILYLLLAPLHYLDFNNLCLSLKLFPLKFRNSRQSYQTANIPLLILVYLS